MSKSLYSKQLGKLVANSTQLAKSDNYHVISSKAKQWAVVREGTLRSVKAFSTQKEAVSFAKVTACKKTGQVIIHAQSGRIRDMISYAKK